MANYHLIVNCPNTKIEVIAKSGEVLANELDIYRHIFLHNEIPEYAKSDVLKTFKTSEQTIKNVQEEVFVVPVEEQFVQNIQVAMPNDSVQIDNLPTIEETTQTQEENKITEEKTEEKSEPHGFSLELSKFSNYNKEDELFDKFMLCANYIRRILKQEWFTIKFLNLKFYPATNKLVDFSIIEKAKSRGFLDVKEIDGVTMYSLNDAGREYLETQL